MDLTEILTPLPLIGDTKSSDIPLPEEYQYWIDRNNRTFYIDYEIEDDYALIELCKTIISMNLEEKDVPKEELKPIKLFVFSYGGDLDQTYTAIDVIASSRIPIITIAMGAAMSGGFLIFVAGHKRYAFQHSNLLLHQGSGGFQGTPSEIDQAQKNYKRQLDQMKDYVLARTSIDEKLFNKNRNKEWYMSADECLKYNVCDEIITDISVLF